MNTTDIDAIDYTILKAVDMQDSPRWKKAIHKDIMEHEDHFPLEDGVSVQTVGRRVDRLLKEDYLESALVEPQELTRDIIIAFDITEKGQEAIEKKREELLKQVVKQDVSPEEQSLSISANALLALMQDEFDLDGSIAEKMKQYSLEELVVLLTIRYAQKEMVDRFDDGHLEEYPDILAKNSDVSSALGIK